MSDQKYFGLVTDRGLAKLRAAAQGETLLLTHVAFGDGGGVETAPSVTATALVNERYRGPVSDLRPHESNPGILYIEGVIPSGTGGWTLREAGVYDNAGDLIVIARPPAMDIALIAEGASVEGLVRLPLVFESLDHVSLLIDPSIVIATQQWSIERLLSRAFVTVDSATITSPPIQPGQHALYFVPTGASGAWGGKEHHLAWHLGASWIFGAPPNGTILAARDTGKYWRKVADGLEEWLATVSRHGLVELATNTETQTGTDAERAVTPAGLSSRAATDTRTGLVELATNAETQAGADTTRAVTPAGLKSAIPQFAGRLLGIKTFTASGTYTPTSGTSFVIVEGCGGGGGGAGGNNPSAGNVSLGSPGGEASSGRAYFTAAQIGASRAVTIGAGGTSSVDGAGTNGGSTSLGTLLTLPGGLGGQKLNNVAAPAFNGNGALSNAVTGANLSSKQGGTPGYATAQTALASGLFVGPSGGSPYGSGRANAPNTNGLSGAGYGSGGAGVALASSGGPAAGGSGAAGLLIIQEFGA